MSRNLRGLSERIGLGESLYNEIVKASAGNPNDRENEFSVIAHDSHIGKSAVTGAYSFYDFLNIEHRQKKVHICDGTSCLVSGGTRKVKNMLLETYNEDEIGTVSCLGFCHSNNAWMKGGEVITEDNYEPKACYPNVGTNAETPALTGPITDVFDYFGVIESLEGNYEKAVLEIEKSGLRGRGGAGFPFHLKVKASRDTEASQKYIVCNADEGDPGAFSDKWLLEERPHSVLLGMLVTGLITGADTGIIYLRGEYPLAVARMKEAIKQLEDEGIIGKIRGDSVYLFSFLVVIGSGAYICGEETSLLNSIEGLRPEVRTRPPFPAVSGLFGRPTVVSNVETFANLRFILDKGGEVYASMGTERSPGTKLVSLDSAFNRPGLYEVRMGTPLKYVFNEMGGGTRVPVRAYQVGGPLGGLVPASMTDKLTLDFESFSNAGFLLGHAGVVSIPEKFPVIEFLFHLFDFARKESCGKCFPCRLGTSKGCELLSLTMNSGKKIDRKLFLDLLETMELGSLCALGGGLPLPVKNAMWYFKDELEKYFSDNK